MGVWGKPAKDQVLLISDWWLSLGLTVYQAICGAHSQASGLGITAVLAIKEHPSGPTSRCHLHWDLARRITTGDPLSFSKFSNNG